MENEIRVKLIKEYRGNINPNRMYHLYDIDNQKECISNLLFEEIESKLKIFKLTLVKQRKKV